MKSKEEIAAELTSKGFETSQIDSIWGILDSDRKESFQNGVGHAYQKVDETIIELTGSQKQGGQLTTSFLKESINLLSQGIEMNVDKKYKDIKTENKTLKEQLANVPDAKKYDDVRNELNLKLQEFEAEKTSLLKGFEKKEKMFAIDSIFNKLEFNTEDKEYLNFKKESVLKNYLDLPLVESNGKAILKGGEKEGHVDIVVEDLLKKEFSSLLKTTQQTTKTNEPNLPSDARIKSVKNKDEFYSTVRASLEEKGLTVTSNNWDSEYAKTIEENKEILQNLQA